MNKLMVAAWLALVSGGVWAGEASAQAGGVPAGEGASKSADQSEELAKWAASRDQRMAWWREARFGMFIHWGLYSGAGGVGREGVPAALRGVDPALGGGALR
jgi:alpha-L-fucosidase